MDHKTRGMRIAIAGLMATILVAGCMERAAKETAAPKPSAKKSEPMPPVDGVETATFGSGCFWCTEAVFQNLKGVQTVTSGYSGGSVKNPTYEQICTKTTGHAEVIQITFDPAAVSYKDLLEVFWHTHDPTTRDRQGGDVGPQYRSVVFYHNDKQKDLATKAKAALDEAKVFPAPIVTEIEPISAFYPAEDYHQNYYEAHSGQPYCRNVIGPKLEKLHKVFQDKLR